MRRSYKCIYVKNETPDEEIEGVVIMDPSVSLFAAAEEAAADDVVAVVPDWEALQKLGKPAEGRDYTIKRVTL